MKLNKLFIGAIAALASAAMVACSDDAPDVNNGGENQDGEETSYLTVNLINPASSGSRTVTSDGFQNGTDTENKVDKVLFIFFNAEGNQLIDPIPWTPEPTDFTPPTSDNGMPGNEEKISVAHLVLKGTEETGKVYPTRALCILNPTDKMEKSINKGMDLGTITNLIGAYGPYGDEEASTNINGTPTAGKFIMTNSVYIDGNRSVIAANIDGHVYDTLAGADSDPATIHVERIVAKVTTSKDNGFKNAGTAITVNDDESVTLIPYIKGIEVANIANNAYLYKQLSVNYPSLTIDANNPWWNAPDRYRSYWETSSAKSDELNNQTWTAISTNKAWDAKNDFYILPNTSATKTSVLITAVLTTDGTEKTAYDLVQYAGAYFTVVGFQGQLISAMNSQNYRISTGNDDEYRTLQVSDIFKGAEGETTATWTWSLGKNTDGRNAYEANIQLTSIPDNLFIVSIDAEGNKIATPVNTTTGLDALNKTLAGRSYRAYYWKNGQTYYYKEIEHFGTNTSNTTNLGVVRNHIYNLTLNSVAGLGTPVPDETEIIKPETPSDVYTFLKAQIHILNWKVVNQTVDFTSGN